MKWYLIWFLTVTLPTGETLNTREESFVMRSEMDCTFSMQIKQLEQEGLLGTTRWASNPTVAPYGGKGTVTGVTVKCEMR